MSDIGFKSVESYSYYLTHIYSYSSLGGTWNATSTSVVNTADSLIGKGFFF